MGGRCVGERHHNFDLKTAYAGIKKNSLEGTWLPWRRGPKSSLDDFFAEHGYMPALHPGEKETIDRVHPRERRQAISITEAQSYDDWCTAQIALSLGNDADHQFFLKRAGNYKNLFRQDKGHVWPKDAEGNWIEPFDPGWSGDRADAITRPKITVILMIGTFNTTCKVCSI
ncbi:MAG: glycoside hydrolase domain-containing protein [Limisphaerales bacterium]